MGKKLDDGEHRRKLTVSVNDAERELIDIGAQAVRRSRSRFMREAAMLFAARLRDGVGVDDPVPSWDDSCAQVIPLTLADVTRKGK